MPVCECDHLIDFLKDRRNIGCDNKGKVVNDVRSESRSMKGFQSKHVPNVTRSSISKAELINLYLLKELGTRTWLVTTLSFSCGADL